VTSVAIQQSGASRFAMATLSFLILSLALTALLPITMAIAIVFLFAGPHNYFEVRYFLSRLPARTGRLTPFFLISFIGIILLSVSLPLISHLPVWLRLNHVGALITVSCWNAMFIAWCGLLTIMRSGQPPRRNWDLTWPVCLGIFSLTLLQPVLLPLALVFAHPLMGLWVLDRELLKSKPSWSRTYRYWLLALPVLVLCLWLSPTGQQEAKLLEITPQLRTQIHQHVGGSMLTFLDARKLVATHAFLELVHYGVWILAIPAASGRVLFDSFQNIPLMRRSSRSRRVVGFLLVAAAAIVFILWVGFVVNYEVTRSIYFTVATVHVLAEVPFLLRLL